MVATARPLVVVAFWMRVLRNPLTSGSNVLHHPGIRMSSVSTACASRVNEASPVDS